VVKQNEYLLQLCDEIERLRKVSIDNINKTDLYTKEDICKILEWYDQLKKFCIASPPKMWVTLLVIKEDRYGSILSVDYEYGSNSRYINIMLAQ
jgi:predicted translin family RNA/ssDNA-binding protein